MTRSRWLVAMGTVAALALWLAWGDEIAARAIPHDQQRYAEMAFELSQGRWLGAYDHMTLIREPAYPVWVATMDAIGAPLRRVAEVLSIAAAWFFASTLVVLGLPRGAALACFAVLVLQPHAQLVNREVLPASFYAPVQLLALAALLRAAAAAQSSRRWAWAASAGVALGLLWTTRPEKPLVVGALLAFVLLDTLARRGRGAGWVAALRPAAGSAALAAASITLVWCAFAAANARHYGAFTTSDLSRGGFAAANEALLSIEHASPRRFVLVPRDVRERAYAASPGFAELRAYLERPGWGRNVSCNLVRVCDDFAGAWFMWTFREAAAAAGHMGSTDASDAYFQRIADEIAQARARGALPPPRTTTGFLHPYPWTYTPHVGSSLRRVARRFAMPGDGPDWDPPRDAASTPRAIRDLFDAVANRSPGRMRAEPVRIEGWAVAADDPVVRVSLRRARPLGARPSGAMQDPMEMAASAFEPRVREKVRFRFTVEKTTGAFRSMEPTLVFGRASGAETAIPVPAEGETAEQDGILLRIDRLRDADSGSVVRRTLRKVAWRVHALWIPLAAVCGVAALALSLAPGFRRQLSDPLVSAGLLLVFVVAGRVVMLALIDASSFPAWSSRYIFGAVSLFSCAALIFLSVAWKRVR
jgi:hypothetical protein